MPDTAAIRQALEATRAWLDQETAIGARSWSILDAFTLTSLTYAVREGNKGTDEEVVSAVLSLLQHATLCLQLSRYDVLTPAEAYAAIDTALAALVD
jgi:hypothetical protein